MVTPCTGIFILSKQSSSLEISLEDFHKGGFWLQDIIQSRQVEPAADPSLCRRVPEGLLAGIPVPVGVCRLTLEHQLQARHVRAGLGLKCMNISGKMKLF